MILRAIVLQVLVIFTSGESQAGFLRETPVFGESQMGFERENPVAKRELWKQCTKKPDGTDTCGWGVDGCFFPDDTNVG